MKDAGSGRWKRAGIGVLSLVVAAAIWLPAVHWMFRPKLEEFRQPGGVAPRARELAGRHLRLWEDPAERAREVSRMRANNAEWDFMGRTYLVLALANMALAEPQEQERYLRVMDAILDDTLEKERTQGMYFFLMPYARDGKYKAQPTRSTFVDGELAMMLAARQVVRPRAEYVPLLAQRVDTVVRYLSEGPVMCGESYPDECWMFCNAVAVAAVRMSDTVDGRDHSSFVGEWLERVKAKLIDPDSGMLVSSFSYAGRSMDGPEGSSIFMIAHCLQIVDEPFAAEQYRLAKAQLGKGVIGFGYAREWPVTWKGKVDVDSGPIVPVVGASAGSSGLAVLGAASFRDDAYLRELVTTLQFAAFPIREEGRLRYAASNQVGDAVILYAMVEGPLWEKVKAASRKEGR